MHSLDIPVHLRLIANNPNTSITRRIDSLRALLKFTELEDLVLKMLQTEFYVTKSSQNIDSLLAEAQSVDRIEAKAKQLLDHDLDFLQRLTSNEQGVVHFNGNDALAKKMVKHLLELLNSLVRLLPTRALAVTVVNNLLRHSRPKGLETSLMDNQFGLFDDNLDELSVVLPLMDTFGLVGMLSNDNKVRLVRDKILLNVKRVSDLHLRNDQINTNISSLMLALIFECPETHEEVLKSAVMPYLAAAFNNAVGHKRLSENVSKVILQIGYQSNDKKMKLINLGFAAGLVTLFDIFSSGETEDQGACANVLKCMANFSVMPVGAEHLLKDKVIPSFIRYFREFRETMPEQTRLIMIALSNMAYMPKKNNLDMIIQDGGVQLMLECLRFAEGKGDDDLVEACIEGMTQISSDDKALGFLEMTDSLDILMEVIRRQTNDKLVYKGLLCLSQFCRKESYSTKILDKGGHSIAGEVIKSRPKDFKNFLQALKFLKVLVATNKGKVKRFSQGGIPEKIVPAFTEDLP
jgi:hypothetical protein